MCKCKWFSLSLSQILAEGFYFLRTLSRSWEIESRLRIVTDTTAQRSHVQSWFKVIKCCRWDKSHLMDNFCSRASEQLRSTSFVCSWLVTVWKRAIMLFAIVNSNFDAIIDSAKSTKHLWLFRTFSSAVLARPPHFLLYVCFDVGGADTLGNAWKVKRDVAATWGRVFEYEMNSRDSISSQYYMSSSVVTRSLANDYFGPASEKSTCTIAEGLRSQRKI